MQYLKGVKFLVWFLEGCFWWMAGADYASGLTTQMFLMCLFGFLAAWYSAQISKRIEQLSHIRFSTPVRHKKTGNLYEIVEFAEFQCSSMPILDGAGVVIYRSVPAGSTLYARLKPEFRERFAGMEGGNARAS